MRNTSFIAISGFLNKNGIKRIPSESSNTKRFPLREALFLLLKGRGAPGPFCCKRLPACIYHFITVLYRTFGAYFNIKFLF
jgi:hypothetical protein